MSEWINKQNWKEKKKKERKNEQKKEKERVQKSSDIYRYLTPGRIWHKDFLKAGIKERGRSCMSRDTRAAGYK